MRFDGAPEVASVDDVIPALSCGRADRGCGGRFDRKSRACCPDRRIAGNSSGRGHHVDAGTSHGCRMPPAVVERIEPDLIAVAELCTELGRAESADAVQPLLQSTARILDAVGLIVWVWDPIANELRPALAHGYSDRVLAQLPRVERDTNNATAAAFRAAQTCVVKSSDEVSGALAVPSDDAGGLCRRTGDRVDASARRARLGARVGNDLRRAARSLDRRVRPAETAGRMFA